MRRAANLLAALAGACGSHGDDAPVVDGPPRPIDAADDAPARTCDPVIGDRAQPLEVRPVFVDYRGQTQPIVGGAVGLIPPIQGGYVLMVGLEARNLDGCEASIRGVLRDPATGASVAEEERPTPLLVGADGWGSPAFPQSFTTANLSTCPPFTGPPPRDIDGNTWRLELVLTETGGRTAMWAGDVVPACRDTEPDPTLCPCQCDSDFRFGDPCPAD